MMIELNLNQKTKIVLILIFTIIFVLSFLLANVLIKLNKKSEFGIKIPSAVYQPEIIPAEFTEDINNKYVSLPVGRTLTYTVRTADGLETTQISAQEKTKTIMGVKTRVVRDKVWLGNKLIENTADFLAQNIVTGDVWYFGEDVINNVYNIEGKLSETNASGSWIAGLDINNSGSIAQPGIWIKTSPRVGETYRQEYYKGKAEDQATVVANNVTVKIGLGTYYDCLKTLDWTPLSPEAKEYKYYCPEITSLVLEENAATGEKSELVSIYNSK